MHAFHLLGLTFIGVIWTVRGATSLRNSASRTSGAERTRQRRQSDISGIPPTQEERIKFLKGHNTYRSDLGASLGYKQPTAPNMRKLYWNAYLEAAAIAWSKEACPNGKFVHGQPSLVHLPEFTNALSQYGKHIGQNLLWFPGDYYDAFDTVTIYVNETYNYNYDDYFPTCKQDPCGHYTQVVWADTHLVGCGYAHSGNDFCSTCNYLTGGNKYHYNPPYILGPPCSGCASDTTLNFTQCEGGTLCVPEDRCSPVKECTVVDKENCLCSAEEYKVIVERMMNGGQQPSNAGQPPPPPPTPPPPPPENNANMAEPLQKSESQPSHDVPPPQESCFPPELQKDKRSAHKAHIAKVVARFARGKGHRRQATSQSSHAASSSIVVFGLLLLLPLFAVLLDQEVQPGYNAGLM